MQADAVESGGVPWRAPSIPEGGKMRLPSHPHIVPYQV